MKSIFKSKTFWVNLIVTVVAILTFLIDNSLIQEYPDMVARFGMIIGAGNIILRCVTDEAIKL